MVAFIPLIIGLQGVASAIFGATNLPLFAQYTFLPDYAAVALTCPVFEFAYSVAIGVIFAFSLGLTLAAFRPQKEKGLLIAAVVGKCIGCANLILFHGKGILQQQPAYAFAAYDAVCALLLLWQLVSCGGKCSADNSGTTTKKKKRVKKA